MRNLIRFNFILLIFIVLNITLSGCVGTSTAKRGLLGDNQSQVGLRSIQTRAFDTADKEKMLRTVIATLQDLDFVIGKADNILGSVTATKFSRNAILKMTVIVRPRGDKQLLVRANAQYGISAVENPETYQDFFNALGKAIFLTAHQVD